MAKITSDQIHALYWEFDETWKKRFKSLKEATPYWRLMRGDIKDLSDQELKDLFLEYSTVSDKFSDELVKQDIEELFSDKNEVAELRRMLLENKWDMEYILHWYAKLWKIRKIEKEIDELKKQINDIKLKLYCDKKSLQTANRVVIGRVQKLQKKIEEKEAEKEKLLSTKEVVAAYELQKITWYADRLSKWQLVYTPSVEKNREEVRNSVLTWQNILLTGPVGTWKTRLAIDIYKEILEEKRKNWELDDEAYKKLSQLCVVNGNEDTSIRELRSRPIQMSNKEWEENVFTYDEWLLTLCLKYGMPLIIDEANRTAPNFLSSLKKFWALKAWQDYKDEITWETFKIKAPLQVILTSNEWQKYGKHTTEFQDQIERELERVYVWYMPENELYDLAKAKLFETPWVANVTEQDLQETLPNLINAVTEVNQLYTSWKEYSSSGSTNDMRLSSTVLDTKRFLQLIDREIIGTWETFWDELNRKIVEFIQWIKPSDSWDMDRRILCTIFHKYWLLCKENIPDLVKWADKLTAYDLSTSVSTERSQIRIPKWNRFVNPWQFAKWYGKLVNREWDVARHRLANFEDLGFDDKGTTLKNLTKSLRWLGILNPMDDWELISKLDKLDENNLEEVITGMIDLVLTRDEEKMDDFVKIFEEVDKIVPGLWDKIWEEVCGDDWEVEILWMSKPEEFWDIPQELKEYREQWKEKIKWVSDESKEKIVRAVDNIPVKVEVDSDGSRLIEFKLWNKTYKILDSKLENHTDDEYRWHLKGSSITEIDKDWVKLWWMKWDHTTSKWLNRKFANYVENKLIDWLHMPSDNEMKTLLMELWKQVDLSEEKDQIAMLMYLTWMDWWYWLSMRDQNSRCLFFCVADTRCFHYDYNGNHYASLLMMSCS